MTESQRAGGLEPAAPRALMRYVERQPATIGERLRPARRRRLTGEAHALHGPSQGLRKYRPLSLNVDAKGPLTASRPCAP